MALDYRIVNGCKILNAKEAFDSGHDFFTLSSSKQNTSSVRHISKKKEVIKFFNTPNNVKF